MASDLRDEIARAIYDSMPVTLKDLASRAEAEAATGLSHGPGVPDLWIADAVLRVVGEAMASDIRPADDRYFVWVCPTHGIVDEGELAEGVDWQNPNPNGDIYTDEFFCQRDHGEGEDHRVRSYDLAPVLSAAWRVVTGSNHE